MYKQKLITLKETSNLLGMNYFTLSRMLGKRKMKGAYNLSSGKNANWKIDLEVFKENFEEEENIVKKLHFSRLKYNFLSNSSYLQTVTQGVKEQHIYHIKELENFFFNKDLTRENVFAFIDYMRNNKKGKKGFRIADGSIRKYVNTLSVIFEEAIKTGIVTQNITRGCRVDLKVNEITRFLNKEQRNALISKCDDDLKDYVNFLVETGVRAGEQENLTWECVDFEKKIF